MMNLRSLRILLIFMCFLTACKSGKKHYVGPYDLNPDMDICNEWHEGLTWQEFQDIRTVWQRPALIPYVNKIGANKLLSDLGFKTVPIIFSSEAPVDFSEILRKHSSYVAKPTYKSANHGLIIVVNGTDIISNQAITPEQVVARMNSLFEPDNVSNSDEWLLQNMPRGFVIQEYITDRTEIKIQTIWGESMRGSSFDGEKYYFYDLEGTSVDRFNFKKLQVSKQSWKDAVTLAAQVAKKIGADAIRVDILVKNPKGPNPELLVNELEFRQKLWWQDYEATFMDKLNAGYSGHCISVE